MDRNPLVLAEVPLPQVEHDELLIKVSCCGICHTELDEIEGRTPPPSYPVIPGHQVVGRIQETGSRVTHFRVGDRVGVAWIHSACGTCEYCVGGLENLCPDFKATGRDVNGGYAEFMIVSEAFACRIPEMFTDTEAAPLLCAGAIGYRSLRLANVKDGDILGLIGFGASAHLVLKMAQFRYPRSKIFIFARSSEEQQFGLSLGAAWAGDLLDKPPALAHAIIDTTPAWLPVTAALGYLRAGGRLVINAIRKESQDKDALQHMEYTTHLWMEKEIKSVANVAIRDVNEFLELASLVPIKPKVEVYPFEKANDALLDLKHKHVVGAKVLAITDQ